MKLSFSPFSDAAIARFLDEERSLPFSYPFVGHTRKPAALQGYDNDENWIDLGQGEQCWAAARLAMRAWRMFPESWTKINPSGAPLEEGGVVAMSARVMGLWWLNSCRIVYVIEEPNRLGFAYGTLPGHVEKGEELFLLELDASGRVRYSIKAVSRPRFWLLWLAYPLARYYQRRFARDSKLAMFKAVVNGG